MEKRSLYESFQSLEAVKELKGVKFAYAVLKNMKMISEEIKLFEEVIKPSPEYERYEFSRIALCESHSEKKEDGTPVIVGDKYKIVDELSFNAELEVLKNDYGVFITERLKQIDEYNKMLNEIINIDFVKINFGDIPENVSAKELESIEFMINME